MSAKTRDLRCIRCGVEMDDLSIDHGDVVITASRPSAGKVVARVRHAACPEPVNPWRGVIGCCTHCEVVQLGDEARWLPLRWDEGRYDFVCCNCDDEPWGLGVAANTASDAVRATQAATAWLATIRGREWLALDECEWCDCRHADVADCANPIDDDG